MNTKALANGVNFTAICDHRFQTARLAVGIFLPLSAENAAKYAILPELLTHATAQSPNMIDLHRRLSRLYGASVGGGVHKLGDHQVVTLSISCIKDRFALSGEAVVEQCAELLLEMLCMPHLSADGLFDAEDVEQEKRCLLERIAAIVNNKRGYAHMRCEELLANGEPFGVSPSGTMETAAALTREAITEAFKTMMETAVFQWVYMGEDDGEAVAARIAAAFSSMDRRLIAGKTITDFEAIETVRRGAEYMQVGQAKLTLGFRLKAHEPQTQSVAVGRLFASLFGGGPVSLLFNNVREKMGLCYYCQASFERVKGVLTVDCGVDAANVERAEQAILEQLAVIQNNGFSDRELESARLRLIDNLRDQENSQISATTWYISQALFLPCRDVQEAIADIQKVTREQIVALANTVVPGSAFVVLPEEDEA